MRQQDDRSAPPALGDDGDAAPRRTLAGWDIAGRGRVWLEGSSPEGTDTGRVAIRGGHFGTAWFVIAGLVVVVAAATGQGGLAVIGLLALVAAGLAWAWARFALRNVVVTAAFARDHVLPGDTVQFTVTVQNHKLLPVPWTTLEIELPRSLRVGEGSRRRLSGEQVLRLSTALAPFGRLTWRPELICPVRGMHRIDEVSIRSGDPFGFFTARLTVEGPPPVVVYPMVAPMPALPDARERMGDVRVPRNLHTDPTRIAGVRDYRPGDSFRMISWKATARTGALQTRIEEPASTRQVLVCLDLETFGALWQGINSVQVETMIATAASILVRAEADGYGIGVVANGLMPGTPTPLSIPVAQGPNQLRRCLDGLARLNVVSAVPFDRTLRVLAGGRGGGRLGDGLVVVVTSWLGDDDRLALTTLARGGRRVIVAPVASEDGSLPTVPGLPIWSIETGGIREKIVAARPVRAPGPTGFSPGE
ncbi:MAG TPA: DUF58 domain-containing protein [Thermomicrobiales bacterium]|jgi:uncharacterized protein (DUF58 family)|nr:DUF58 domain-containing protein [Thermomicrobiales bacterium]